VPDNASAHRLSAALLVLFSSLLLSLGAAEIGLRLFARRPWKYADVEAGEPTLHQLDPVLGWTNKPGHYVRRLPNTGVETEVTILPDASRATGPSIANDGRRVVLVGCSVTVGYGLSDADTFAWKLEQLHPELHVVNFGTAAYGTFQSLLRMEKAIAESPPSLVLYGFISQHESRNVATYDWLRGLAQNSHRGHVAPPYVTLAADGGLVRHAPEQFAVWPLARLSVIVRVADDAYMHLRTHGREAEGPEATKRLVLEMSRFAREHSTPFAVVFLLAEEDRKKEEYLAYFRERQIPYVDCVEPFTDDNKIPGEGHPNAKVNSLWARCISDRLPMLLRSGSPTPR
jgi:hypothetical protein